MRCFGFLPVFVLILSASPLLAESRVLVLKGARAPLVALNGGSTAGTGAASLFAGDRNGLFRPVVAPIPPAAISRHGDRAVARLLDLIARAEAGQAGYDAVQHGATVKPPGKPSDLTIAQIFDWISNTPGQPHAIGRYQVIPATLRRLVAAEGLPKTTRFAPEVQDRLAHRLLDEAGLDAFRNGTLSRAAFMNNLAKIWAGLPTSSGRSHYHGYAGNKATLNRSQFDRDMRAIFGGTEADKPDA